MSSLSFDQVFSKNAIFDDLQTDIYKTGKRIERVSDAKGYMNKFLDESILDQARI